MIRGAENLLRRYRQHETRSRALPPTISKGRVQRLGDLILIEAPYSAELGRRVRKLPGPVRSKRNPDNPDLHQWTLKAHKGVATPLEAFIRETGFTVNGELLDWANAGSKVGIRQQEDRGSIPETKVIDFIMPNLGREPRPHQIEGISIGATTGSILIADEPGLGKTGEALGILEARGAYPAVVISPAVGKIHWLREAEIWLPHRTVAIADGKTIPETDIIIATWDFMGRSIKREEQPPKGKRKPKKTPEDFRNLPSLILKKPLGVVFDESHMAKNSGTLRAQSARLLSSVASTRICLTGTPIESRPIELASQLEILGIMDKIFGSWWAYAKRHCGAHRTRFGIDANASRHLGELHEKLRRSGHYLRRLKSMVTDLPPKSRVTIPVSITNRADYKKAEADVIAWIGRRAAADKAFRDSIAHLSIVEQRILIQERRETAEERAAKAEALVRIEALKQVAARGKLAATYEWIDSFLESGEKLVVFAWHNEIVEAIVSRYGKAAVRITGNDIRNRQANVDKFQGDPACRICVCNLRAGGVLLTLTAASNVLFVELGWTPTGMIQAEDRCHRIGQNDRVTAWYLLSTQTIEEEIYELIRSKMGTVAAVTDGLPADEQSESVFKAIMASLTKKSDDL
jgi:SWI/SNF-related matrix-associated actin-dependent regulator 1 of chromatin subfamily A